MDEPLKNRLTEEEGGVTYFEPLSVKYEITFDAIGGLDELKKQASMKIIQPFKNPELFKKFKKKCWRWYLIVWCTRMRKKLFC